MHDAKIYRRAAIVAALFAALGAIATSSAVHRALVSGLLLTDEVIAQHAIAGAVLFVLLAALSSMLAFVSMAVLVPAAVSAWGTPLTGALLWLGWIAGGIATYCVGSLLGRPVMRWLAADRALKTVQSLLPADAPLASIVLLQLALPSEIPGYVLGLLRYPLARYVAALAMAELPYALATVYLGASFIQGRGGIVLLIGMFLTALSLAAFSRLRGAMRARKPIDKCSTADVLNVGLQ